MSMYRQIWLATISGVVLAVGGVLLASLLGTRSFLESELTARNRASATALATMLGLEKPEPTHTELLVASLFDGGHYENIRIRDVQGQTVAERSSSTPRAHAPSWFVEMLPIAAAPGQADIGSGWLRVGSVDLRGDSRFAYDALWEFAQHMGLAVLAVALICGLLATLVLRRLHEPLHAVIEQAQALSERRFVTMAAPAVPELRPLVAAMNKLVERLKALLESEAARLERLLQADRTDTVTGLMSRSAFLKTVSQALHAQQPGAGFLVIVRLANLATMNRLLGRESTNHYLLAVSRELRSVVESFGHAACGRLNGGDFAMLLPAQALAEAQAQQCLRALRTHRKNHWPQGTHTAWIGWGRFQAGESLDAVLARTDLALAAAEAEGTDAVRQSEHARHIHLPRSTSQWNAFINQALAQQSLRLAFRPANTMDGQLLVQEATQMLPSARADATGSARWLSAAQFMPVAQRLLRSTELDLGGLQIALNTLSTRIDWPALALPISAASLAHTGFLGSVLARLDAHGDVTQRLVFQVSEGAALANLDALGALVRAVSSRQCRLGISHCGHRFGEITQLYELSPSYLLLDASLLAELQPSEAPADYVRGLCNLAHNLGWQVLAQDVGNREQLLALRELGLDGATGDVWGLGA